MYPNSGATPRADLNIVLEEASMAESGLIGEILMPQYGVDAKSGTYVKIKKASGELLKPGSTRRERGGSYGKVKRAWETDTYDTYDRGLEEEIDDCDVKDASRLFDMEAMTAKLVKRAVMLDHEIRVKDEIMSTTNFGSAASPAVNYTEANIATIDFPLDIMTAIETIANAGETADTIVLTPNLFNRIRRSTLLKSFLVGSNLPTASITPNTIQAAFAPNGIKQVLIGRGRYDTTVKKSTQTYTAGLIWPDTYIWVGKVASGDFTNGGAGRTLVWNKEGGLFVSESYRIEERRVNVVRVRQHTAEKVIDANCGTLITTNYS
jgi:hypothetical protein